MVPDAPPPMPDLAAKLIEKFAGDVASAYAQALHRAAVHHKLGSDVLALAYDEAVAVLRARLWGLDEISGAPDGCLQAGAPGNGGAAVSACPRNETPSGCNPAASMESVLMTTTISETSMPARHRHLAIVEPDGTIAPVDFAPAISDSSRTYLLLNDQDLATAIHDARTKIALLDSDYQALTKTTRDEIREMEGHLLARLEERGARAIPHDDLVVEIDVTTRIDKRVDVLRQLIGKVPSDELRKALYLEQPEPEWKADARYLAPLAKKYGGEVADIIAAGIIKVVVGQSKLRVAARPPEKMAIPTGGDA